MKYTIFKLKNLTPLHIGTGKENYDFSSADLHSDTLSAALAAMRAQQGKFEDIDGFLNSFSISSAFPFSGDRLFLPKPQGRLNVRINGQEEHLYRKKLKKVKYIEVSLWNKLINGEDISIEPDYLKNEFLFSNETTQFTLFKNQVSQRVTVPRTDGQDATPFFFDWKYFDSNSGLYCIVKCEEETILELTELFTILGVNGLGTDKNIGGGKFDVEIASIELEAPTKTEAAMLLSLYIPTEEELKEIDLSCSRYEIVQRGGYMAGSVNDKFKHLIKKTVYMFNTGSVLAANIPLEGKIVDLRPEWNDSDMHPVYRSGKPFYIPIKLSNNE